MIPGNFYLDSSWADVVTWHFSPLQVFIFFLLPIFSFFQIWKVFFWNPAQLMSWPDNVLYDKYLWNTFCQYSQLFLLVKFFPDSGSADVVTWQCSMAMGERSTQSTQTRQQHHNLLCYKSNLWCYKTISLMFIEIDGNCSLEVIDTWKCMETSLW